MKPQLLIFFFGLLLAQNVAAQQDYIITAGNDTIYGDITASLLGKTRFTPDGESKSQPVSPEKVKEYFNLKTDKYYTAKILPGKSRYEFLQRLENGKIQLFEYFRSTYSVHPGIGGNIGAGVNSNERRWFVCKENGPLAEVKSNLIWGSRQKRKDTFYLLISDNKAVLEKFTAEEKFSFDKVRELIREYNQY